MTSIGRNAPCPCGSGRKYKHCCARRETSGVAASAIPAHLIAGHPWEADIFPFPVSFDDDPKARPTAVMVTSNELVLATDILTAPLGEVGEIAARLARAVEDARRKTGVSPAEVLVRWKDVAEALRPMLPAGTQLRVEPFLEDLTVPARAMLSRVAEFPHWPPVSQPDSWLAWGLPRPVIAGLFDAAAAFHRARPWRWLEDVPPLEAKLAGGREWTVAIMGSGGREFGLTIYADLEDYLRTISVDDAAEGVAGLRDRTIGLGLGRLGELPRPIQREVASSGWKVAAPNAYPILIPMNTPAGGISRADAADLIVLLRAIPAFVAEQVAALQSGKPDAIEWTHRETGAELRFDPVPYFAWLELKDPSWMEPPPPRKRRRAPPSSPSSRDATAPPRPPRGTPAAAGETLTGAFALIEAYPRRDPTATADVVAQATDLLRVYALHHVEEMARALKPEVWAAGALHAAFQDAGPPRTGTALADAFGVSASAVVVRSRRLRETADRAAAKRPADADSRPPRRPADRETLSLWPDAKPPQSAGEKDTRRTPSSPSFSREAEAQAGPGEAEVPMPVTGPRLVREEIRGGRGAADGAKREKPGLTFTPLQGQYLAFIHAYTKLNRRPPAETDMQAFFRVTPPAVHNMVKALDKKGLIARVPGQARTIRVLVPREDLPDLE